MITREQAQFLDDHGDDIYGLWEVGWYFIKIRPSISQNDQCKFVANLVETELLDVFHTNSAGQRGEPLQPDAAREAVVNEQNWIPPQEGTDGQQYYVKESYRGEMVRKDKFSDI